MTLEALSIRAYAFALRHADDCAGRKLEPGLTVESHAVHKIHGVSDAVLAELADGAEVGRIPHGDGWEQPCVTVSVGGGLAVLACGAARAVAAPVAGRRP